jgi:glycosyltransferase involved in cell wall biosynthesis
MIHVGYLLSGYHSASAGGGAESYISTMADGLIKAGCRVTMVVLSDKNETSYEGPVRVVKVRSPNWHWRFYRCAPRGKPWNLVIREIEWSFVGWNAVARMHKRDRFDVVEAGETMVLKALTLGKKPPLVVRGHGNRLALKRSGEESIGSGDLMARRIQVAAIRKAAAVTAVSSFQAREIARDSQIKEDHISVIPNPISESLLQDALSQTRTEPQSPVVLYTGRIEHRKGTLDLLQSIPAVASTFPDVKYLVVGGRHNSIDDKTLNETLNRPGVGEHTELVGHVQWQQLADWYRRASVFVMPSLYETFGISVIEAMAFGLPVVATNVGGLPEVVQDGVTGILVPPKDPNALADAVIRLLRDSDLRRRMGDAGRERVLKEFRVDRIVEQTLKVYQSVCS